MPQERGEPAVGPRPHVAMRGIYGGFPTQLMEGGKTLSDHGVNAIFVGSDTLDERLIARVKEQGAKVYAEFNTMHVADFLKENPDAAPVGTDGGVCPPPDGWQGICPTHGGYRAYRMDAFGAVLEKFELDGIWLDYHHGHASWEQAEPNMPDTCFCRRCLAQFTRDDTGVRLLNKDEVLAASALREHRDAWVAWRCGVFADWVREFRATIDATRPKALLGTFHCPWSEADFDGALRDKLAIDLKAQAPYVDVFSTMPYHARLGHAQDPAWISRQTGWLGAHLDIKGNANEARKIWPIVQLSDWGGEVPVAQVKSVLDHGTRSPSTGVLVFAWGSLEAHAEKVEQMGAFFRAISA